MKNEAEQKTTEQNTAQGSNPGAPELPHSPHNAALRVYISGPMTNVPHFNRPAFEDAARRLRGAGFDVVSPVEMDAAMGINLDDATPSLPGKTRKSLLARDFVVMVDCDAIFMLKGWSRSGGAKLERAFALDTGMSVLYDDDAEREEAQPQPQPQPSGEVRVVDPKTGGAKGQKLERMDLVPVGPLLQLARVYGMGARKYTDNNWRLGYKWSLNYAALMRHAMAFWGGQDTDPESGLPHMAHCAWHAFALMEFATTYRDGDDRFKGVKHEAQK